MAANLKLRDFAPADLPRMLALDQVCFEEGIAYPESELRAFLAFPGAICMVAESGKTLAGFILLHILKRATGHVITIDVHPEFRRSGLGNRLMTQGEARLIEGGCSQVVLEVAVNNLGAIAFYEGLGYQVLRTLPRYYLGSLDGLLMGKRLV